MSVAAVVLAAGASSRMGRPKALIEWRGRPFFMHCSARASDAGCAPVVVVWGATALPEGAASLVHNPTWWDGPLSSLQAGLRAVVPSGPSAVLVLTVDRPHVQADTLEQLLAAHAAAPAHVVQPEYERRRGHPIVLPASLLNDVLALPPTDTLRSVVGRSDVVRTFVHVEDAAVRDNLDTPDDLRRLPA
ncbi:MAG: nucleotidyltransferase family protein [Myxococcota bacterium]